jgi:3-hydroxyisobutyrate dehydrogenase-like beta-hydroxyacid dehydrogenase
MAEEKFEPAGFKMSLGLKDTNLALAAAEQVTANLVMERCYFVILSF